MYHLTQVNDARFDDQLYWISNDDRHRICCWLSHVQEPLMGKFDRVRLRLSIVDLF